MATVKADFDTVMKVVIKIINAGTRVPSWATTIEDDRRVPEWVKEAVLAADTAVCLAIIETEGHSFLSDFTAPSDELTDPGSGVEIPAHPGVCGVVRVKINASDSVFVPGSPADSLTDILQFKRNSIFGSKGHTDGASLLGGFYFIQGNILHFTGARATVDLALTYSPINLPYTCQAPLVYSGTVAADAVSRLVTEGDDAMTHSMNLTISKGDMALIRGGKIVVPSYTAFLKAAEDGRAN